MHLTMSEKLNVRIHVCEPEESTYKEMWYKDPGSFEYSKCFEYPEHLNVGDIIEDDMGTRFKILSRHWKWEKEDLNITHPILEFTVERYVRHGKQNPFML